MKRWRCPACGLERQSFAKPNHKHDGAWVGFEIVGQPPLPAVDVAASEPVPRRKPGRPRKVPAE